MKSKEPYFKNVPYLDDLYMEFIIFEYECPILFVCKNKEDRLYICVCYDIRESQQWIVAPIDQEILIQLLTNQIAIRDAFALYRSEEKRYLINWKKVNGEGKYSCRSIMFSDIPDEILPVANETIEAEDDEYAEFIEVLRRREKKSEQSVFSVSKTNLFKAINYMVNCSIDTINDSIEQLSISMMSFESNLVRRYEEPQIHIYNNQNDLYIDSKKEYQNKKIGMVKKEAFTYGS